MYNAIEYYTLMKQRAHTQIFYRRSLKNFHLDNPAGLQKAIWNSAFLESKQQQSDYG